MWLALLALPALGWTRKLDHPDDETLILTPWGLQSRFSVRQLCSGEVTFIGTAVKTTSYQAPEPDGGARTAWVLTFEVERALQGAPGSPLILTGKGAMFADMRLREPCVGYPAGECNRYLVAYQTLKQATDALLEGTPILNEVLRLPDGPLPPADALQRQFSQLCAEQESPPDLQ